MANEFSSTKNSGALLKDVYADETLSPLELALQKRRKKLFETKLTSDSELFDKTDQES